MTNRLAVLVVGLLVSTLGGALAYLLGYLVGRLLDTSRGLRVPLLTCATHNRHAVLSRRNAGRTAMPRHRQVSRTGHHSPVLEATLPRVTTSPTSAPSADLVAYRMANRYELALAAELEAIGYKGHRLGVRPPGGIA